MIPNNKKYELLTSHFSQGADYNFPQGADKRLLEPLTDVQDHSSLLFL